MDNSRLMQESPDWFGETRLFSSKKLKISLKISLSNIFATNWEQLNGAVIFKDLLITFFMDRKYISFFHSDGNQPILRTSLKLISNGL